MKKYIVFEGIAGSGKSLMISEVGKWLTSLGLKVWTMEEPSEKIKEVIGTYDIDDRIDTLLFVADRLIQQKNLQKLPDDVIVLAERCFLSTFAYQSSILIGNLFDLHNIYFEVRDFDMVLASDTFIFPDAVIILDISVEKGIGRKEGRYQKWENKEVLEEVRQKFKQMTIDKKYPFEIYLINSDRNMEETFKQVQSIIKNILKL
ncbi:MAG: dTMP kinase [Candidatus Helarchaeota archaeon]